MFLLQVVVYSHLANLNLVLFLPVFIGWMTTSLTYHIKEAVGNIRKNGTIWSMKTSAYFKSEETDQFITYQDTLRDTSDGSGGKISINRFNVIAVLTKSLVTMSSQAMKISVMYTAACAGLSYSLVINLYSLTPFFTAIAFYFLFKEKLNSMHLIGMALLFVCIVITS